MITDEIKNSIEQALKDLGIESAEVELEHPAEIEHGDFSTNAALKYAGESNPREFADKIVASLKETKPSFVGKVEVAGPGFINFYFSREFFAKSIEDIAAHGDNFGKNESLEGKRIMVEYTDPNPFKEFHAGHVMNNAIGEAIARLYEWQGAEVIRANYQGDVGPHVAKAIWGMQKNSALMPLDNAPLSEKVAFLGDAYVEGSKAYEESKEAKKEIDEINRRVYERIDDDINELYQWGRTVSLSHFEEIYKKLGTTFDRYFFESQVFEDGLSIVQDGLQRNVFEESNGAIVYRGEKDDLHTRVFVTSAGLPTYEAKELGLTKQKFETDALDGSVVVTANEQTSYFQVVVAALSKLKPEWSQKTKHIEHGMLKTPEGKMSSRRGNVLGGGTLIDEVEERARQKIKESDRELEDQDKLATQEAVAAVKYAVLRQMPGKDVVFDKEQSLSLEGDSGPYLQYTHTRCVSVLNKAKTEGLKPSVENPPIEVQDLERMLYRFPEIVYRSFQEYAPQQIITYLTEIASLFNNFYSEEKIVNADDEYSPYKLALTRAVQTVIYNGLYILGISAPDRM